MSTTLAVVQGEGAEPNSTPNLRPDPVAEFLAYLQFERACSPLTVQAYRGDLNQFADFLAMLAGRETPIINATVGDMQRYMEFLGRFKFSPASAARKIAVLRSFGRFCMRRGFTAGNPAAMIETPRQEKRLPRFLTETEAARLLEPPINPTMPQDSRCGRISLAADSTVAANCAIIPRGPRD